MLPEKPWAYHGRGHNGNLVSPELDDELVFAAWLLCPDVEPSVQERRGPDGVSPEEGHQNDLRDGTPPSG